MASCYKKWVKNNRVNESDPPNHDYSTACRILLFPLDQMCELSDDLERVRTSEYLFEVIRLINVFLLFSV